MKLSRPTLKDIVSDKVVKPDADLLALPEKVLQFGTGVLLRGLPDYFIDKANRKGLFNGRIVVVKSTTQGDTTAFDTQDGLYTLCVRGLQNGHKVEENIIQSAVSRVVNAATHWEQVLQCAHNPDLQVIISNTTEVGIQLVDDDIRLQPPVSFPGKLLAFLYERYQAWKGSAESGMVIIPTELIPDNGNQLKAVILQLAQANQLEAAFIEWLHNANSFCNSLVDRIVPGRPDAATLSLLQEELGYEDQLLILSEVYRLWAIEGDERVKQKLSFAPADPGVIIEPDIKIYRELKLRLLNGTHTLSCGLAFLAGCETVKEAMEDTLVADYIAGLMLHELAPAIPYEVSPAVAQEFGASVLDRFRNPFIRHQWINITLQYSSKIKTRCVQVLLKHYALYQTVPEHMALGFAAYLLFTRPVRHENSRYYGVWKGQEYVIQDDRAAVFYQRWQELQVPQLVQETLLDKEFWGADLSILPHFTQAVTDRLNSLIHNGIRETMAAVVPNMGVGK